TIDLRSSRGAAAKATRHSVAITEGSPTSSLPTGACSPTYDRPVPERPFASVCRFGVRLQFGREQAFASLLVSAGARGGSRTPTPLRALGPKPSASGIPPLSRDSGSLAPGRASWRLDLDPRAAPLVE